MNKFIFSILSLVFAVIIYQSHLEKSKRFSLSEQKIESHIISEAKAEIKPPEVIKMKEEEKKVEIKVASIKPKAKNTNARASLKSQPDTIIYFDEAKSEISEAEIQKLNRLITKTSNKPILLFAYNDSFGSNSQNRKLSTDRVKSIENFLKSKGINLEIKSQIFGSDNSLESNKTAIGRANNRRIEIFTDY